MTEPTSHSSSTLRNSTVKYNAPWEEYQRPYVRDLAYVLSCPDVLTKWLDFVPHQDTPTIAVHNTDFWQAQFAAYRERLNELDTTSAYQELTRYLLKRPSPNRLGFHFEGLLSFWLTDGYAHGLHPYEMLANNVQLFCGKQTTGELDLILYNHREKLTEHWELAIKFFMGSAPFAPVNWVGINSNDNLQRKMTHMQTKQFCTVWVDTENHGQVKIDKRYAVIKGHFFLPVTTVNFIYPDWLAPSFPMHYWLAASNNQNNIDDHSSPELTQNQNHVNNFDNTTGPLAGITDIRRAHYIEWFTQRNFYDCEYPENNSVNSNDKISPNLASLQQGLYFMKVPMGHWLDNHLSNDSSQAQDYYYQDASYKEHYVPVVILQTDVNTDQDGLSD
ncbi:DUF1853 family protein [Psychrobacter sp. CAL346-MNA-CIBAN-0220]|uniref:DUF1853 family protein n=1 Tax=Psychrobacter sp. CAL346-MNA-CIBAN-0220 TaxID=3140457 RepID=UPI003331BCC3